MRLHPIQLVTIIAEPSLESKLTSELRLLGATGYTVLEGRGAGTRGGSRGIDIPGANVRIETLVPHAVAERIVEHLAQHYFTDYSLAAYVTDVGVVRTAKYDASARGTTAAAPATELPHGAR